MKTKIENFKSIILEDLTLKEFEYSGLKLGKYSKKYIYASCRFCGEPKKIRRNKFEEAGCTTIHLDPCRKEELKVTASFNNKDVLKKANQSNKSISEEKKKIKSQKIKDSLKKSKEKRQRTIKEKYGVDNVSQNKDIKEKIRKKVSNPETIKKSLKKRKKTCLKKYGKEYYFKTENFKNKSKNTIIKKYNVDHISKTKSFQDSRKKTCLKKYGENHHLKNKKILNKQKNTNLKRYGIKNVSQSQKIKNKSIKSLNKTIKENKNDQYNLINLLRYNDVFWKKLSDGKNLKDICKDYNINYGSLTCKLVNKEFKNKYYSTYTFPNIQKQKEIYNELKEYNIKCELNTRQVIKPLELDIYLPDYNFAIEFNGNVWHSEYMIKNIKAAKYKHLNKTKLCEEKGIRLFHIFEHQWENRKDQILNFIKTILRLNEINVPARKCLVDHSSANDFINKNHIQGNTNHVLRYFNLVYNGEIVASLTASKHHRQNTNNNDIILSRLCFKNNTNVQGGSSKLFKYFKIWSQEQGYDNIISWSDNCWTQGNIYKVLNFELEKEYYPDYFYYNVKTHEVKSKQSQKKSLTGCPKETLERDWCIKNNLYRIWDCGKKKWIYSLKNGEYK